MVIQHYNTYYNLDDELAKEINSFFSLWKSGGGMNKFLDFMTADEIQPFFDKLSKKYQDNPNLFKQLTKVINKLGKPNYVFLLLMSLVLKNVDIGATIKSDDAVHFQNIMKIFDKSCFFAIDAAYKKFINGCSAFGFPTKNTSTQFVTSVSYADKIMLEVSKQKSWDDMQSVYTTKLGYSKNYLNNVKEIYRIDLNGKKIKEDAEITHGISTLSIHLPNGVEPGANDYWLPGGYTSGGLPEVVLNGIPNTKRYVIQVIEYKIDKDNAKITSEKYSSHKYHS